LAADRRQLAAKKELIRKTAGCLLQAVRLKNSVSFRYLDWENTLTNLPWRGSNVLHT
jgi:hypothetical protein